MRGMESTAYDREGQAYPLRGRLAPVAKSGVGTCGHSELSTGAGRSDSGLASCRRLFKEFLCGASATPASAATQRLSAAFALKRGYAGLRAGWLCEKQGLHGVVGVCCWKVYMGFS